VDQQQSQAAQSLASASMGPTEPVSQPARTIDPGALAQLELTGGDPAELLGRLVSSLRAGLPVTRLRDVTPTLQLPTETEAAALFGSRELEAPIDGTVQHTQDLPKEALSVQPADPLESARLGMGPPDMGRMIALMVQDMAAFGGGAGRESVRLNPPVDIRFDYFA
jgi:hypothetical protein